MKQLSAFCLLLLALNGCKKADNFYSALQAVPQIMNSPAYAYNSSYVVGDTLVITGKLQPQAKDFAVSVGGIAGIVTKTGSISVANTLRDQVYVLISSEMVGKAREVKITSGGYATLGASVDVYGQSGENSFNSILTNRTLATFSDNTSFFLHCINGKGDIYYYTNSTKKLYQVKKDGTQILIYDLSADIQPGNISISEFVAGGVTPGGQELYFSAKTTAGDYLFARIDLRIGLLSIINRSTAVAAPFEGIATDVKMTVTDIYPDDKGNVYLCLGFNTGLDGAYYPGAIARYRSNGNTVKYIFRELNYAKNYTGMPGTDISFSYLMEFRINPAENLLYLMQASYLGNNSTGIDVYDLPSATKIQTMNSNASSNETAYNVVNNFANLSINLAFNAPATAYGYMPMPGRRLQVLMYQEIGNSVSIANTKDFPRWIVFDFQNERTYAYAQDRFRLGSNSFGKGGLRKDELLNYDEDGNLYSTANGRITLLATRPIK